VKILHAGCGGEYLPPQYLPFNAEEVRLDANPDMKPDIVASIDDLGDIGPFDGIHCSHCLEHLQWDHAHKALSEFYRVLNVGGFLYIQVPNLEGIKPTLEVLYEVNGLKITGIDILYGCRHFAKNNEWMLHRSGWIPETLVKAFEDAGFQHVGVRSGGLYLDVAGIKL
jgi:ubiquinone/menaquinone biosynthesis C-methylase UbiE